MTDAIAARDESPLAAMLANPTALKEMPVETVERLFALHERAEANRAKRAFAVAFNAVQADLEPVQRAARNTQTGSMYARAEDVSRMLDPIIVQHGFSRSISAGSTDAEGMVRFELKLRHIGGHEETHHLDAPIDDRGMKGSPTKTQLHGLASSFTYCERHLLCKVFGVHLTADTDGNPRDLERCTDAQVAEVDKLITDQPDLDRERFLRMLKVETLSDMSPTVYKRAKRLLEKRIAENAA